MATEVIWFLEYIILNIITTVVLYPGHKGN